jgi:ribosome-binding protein aMBF1 (putative translation factor)
MIRLRHERAQRGLSQARLARRARISNSDLCRIEGGWLRPYPNQLRRLAKALGWPPETADQLLVTMSPETAVK